MGTRGGYCFLLVNPNNPLLYPQKNQLAFYRFYLFNYALWQRDKKHLVRGMWGWYVGGGEDSLKTLVIPLQGSTPVCRTGRKETRPKFGGASLCGARLQKPPLIAGNGSAPCSVFIEPPSKAAVVRSRTRQPIPCSGRVRLPRTAIPAWVHFRPPLPQPHRAIYPMGIVIYGGNAEREDKWTRE